MNSLEQELHSFKVQNDDRAKESIEVSEQCQAVKAEICAKDGEIREIQQVIQTTICENQSHERDIEVVKSQLAEQQDLRAK